MSINNQTKLVLKRIQDPNLSRGMSMESFLRKHNMLPQTPTNNQHKTLCYDEETEINSHYSDKRKRSFISMNKKQQKLRKTVRFIDLIDKTKPLCEIIDIQAYKTNMIMISNEKETNQCTCIIN